MLFSTCSSLGLHEASQGHRCFFQTLILQLEWKSWRLLDIVLNCTRSLLTLKVHLTILRFIKYFFALLLRWSWLRVDGRSFGLFLRSQLTFSEISFYCSDCLEGIFLFLFGSSTFWNFWLRFCWGRVVIVVNFSHNVLGFLFFNGNSGFLSPTYAFKFSHGDPFLKAFVRLGWNRSGVFQMSFLYWSSSSFVLLWIWVSSKRSISWHHTLVQIVYLV
jgi:hypothetical protein